MTDTRPRLTPGPDHPITVDRHDERVVVRAGDAVVADTGRALEMHEASHPPVLYVPIDDVDRDLLRPSDHHTYCPYKGEASYYDIATGDGVVAGAVWYYEQPYEAVGAIAGHVAFYTDRVTVAAS